MIEDSKQTPPDGADGNRKVPEGREHYDATDRRDQWLEKVARVFGKHLGREVTREEAILIDAGMGALCRAFIETEGRRAKE